MPSRNGLVLGWSLSGVNVPRSGTIGVQSQEIKAADTGLRISFVSLRRCAV